MTDQPDRIEMTQYQTKRLAKILADSTANTAPVPQVGAPQNMELALLRLRDAQQWKKLQGFMRHFPADACLVHSESAFMLLLHVGEIIDTMRKGKAGCMVPVTVFYKSKKGDEGNE